MPFIISSFVSRGIAGRNQQPETPPPATPITPPNRWGHYGDSQTGGRASETPTAQSHSIAFQNIWNSSGFGEPLSITRDGVGGRALAGHRTAYEGDSFASNPWIHVQESGGQNSAGQMTAAEFGATFQSFMEKIKTDYPDSFISYETAFSFGREAEAYRNWDSYNDELRSRVSALALSGIEITLVESDYWIKQLVSVLTYDVVCFPNAHPNAYHYQGIGNFMIALAMFHAFGYVVSELDHSSVLLDSGHKSTAVGLFSE